MLLPVACLIPVDVRPSPATLQLTTSLMTCIFPMPRIVYGKSPLRPPPLPRIASCTVAHAAIASDGLLPPWLGAVSPRFNTPVAATLLCGLLAATMALIFDVQTLASMMSIGTLIAYTYVGRALLTLPTFHAPCRSMTGSSASAC